MPTLSLRLDLIDNSNALQPAQPRAYTVLGFTCGSVARVSTDPEHVNRWFVHLALPDEPLKRLPRRFLDPHAALHHVQEWCDEMERKHAGH